MPIGIHRIVLDQAADEEKFERFMTEEIFPAARTLVRIRIGQTDIRHMLVRNLRDETNDAPCEYLWIIEVDQGAIQSFATDLGAELKARLDSFGTRTYSAFQILSTSESRITTPSVSQATPAGDPSGWVGE
jgi:hypothetical protein